MTITSQNVQGFKLEKEQDLLNNVINNNVFAAALQETWRLGDTELRDPEKGCIIINHAPSERICRRGALGVAIVLSPAAVKAWEKGGNKILYFGPRIVAVRLVLEDALRKPIKFLIASGYAPHSGRPQEEKDDFADNLQQCFDACGKDEIPVIALDTNASLGVRSKLDTDGVGKDKVRGRFGEQHENSAGRDLHALLGVNELCAASTFFQKRDYATWIHPASRKGHQLDHIIVRQQDMKRVRDAGFIGWQGVDSDHRAVGIRLALARNLKRKPSKEPNKGMRIDRELLKNDEIRKQFQIKVNEHLGRLRELRSTDNSQRRSDLTLLEEAMQEASKDTLKSTKKRKPGWYTARIEKLEPLIQSRNAAQAAYNASPTDGNKRRLQLVRTYLKKEVVSAMKAWIESVVVNINGLHKGTNGDGRDITAKEAWDAVQLLRRGLDCKTPVAAMKLQKSDGTYTESPEEAGDIMTDYLKKTFSKIGAYSEEAVKLVPQRRLRPEMNKPPSFDEYKLAVTGLNNNKAPGDDGICAELYKALLEDHSTENLLYDVLIACWKTGSYPGDEVTVNTLAEDLRQPTIEIARRENWRISYVQENPKRMNTASQERYEIYKSATSIEDALSRGAKSEDIKWDLERKFLRLHDPALEPSDALNSALADDSTGLVYEEWLVARLKLLPKKGDLSQCKNWRGICLLDVASKVMSSILVRRMQEVLKECGLEIQAGFTPDRGTTDSLFSLLLALQKRKEHNLDTFVLFIDLVKAFDSVPRDALFAVLRRFGLPDHFINLAIRLHKGAKIKVKIGDVDHEIDSSIGVRQGSCEGPVLFLFIMQAAMETLVWPNGVGKPVFRTRMGGKTMGEKWDRKRGVTSFDFWASLFADDCAVLFNSRMELISGTQHLFHHLRKFGLEMHVGRGTTASKTEAMYCPKPRKLYEEESTDRFQVDGDGFIDFTKEFKYLGSIINSSLTSDSDVDKRIKSATAIFGALSSCIFSKKDIDLKVKGQIYSSLVLSVLLYGSETWALREDLAQRLRSFHHRCARTMCRVTMAHTIRCKIKTSSLLERLGIQTVENYYHRRLLRWAGHVARMDENRMPRKLITGWVAHPRPRGCPYMTWGRTLKKALKCNQIDPDFAIWSKQAQNRGQWAALINSNKDQTRAASPARE